MRESHGGRPGNQRPRKKKRRGKEELVLRRVGLGLGQEGIGGTRAGHVGFMRARPLLFKKKNCCF
jgi:hypothetical protein